MPDTTREAIARASRDTELLDRMRADILVNRKWPMDRDGLLINLIEVDRILQTCSRRADRIEILRKLALSGNV